MPGRSTTFDNYSGDPPGVLVCLDDDDLGMSLKNAERRRADVESAEAVAQGFMLFRRQKLISEEADKIFEQHVVNFSKPWPHPPSLAPLSIAFYYLCSAQ